MEQAEAVIRAEYNKGIKNQEKARMIALKDYWQGRIDTALAIAKRLGMKL